MFERQGRANPCENPQGEEPLRKQERSVDNGGTSGLGLSPEEQRIVALVLAGYKNRDIAGHLCLNDSKVRCCFVRALGQLGLCDKLELTLCVLDRQRFA